MGQVSVEIHTTISMCPQSVFLILQMRMHLSKLTRFPVVRNKGEAGWANGTGAVRARKTGGSAFYYCSGCFYLLLLDRNRLSKLPLQGVMSPLPRFPFPQPHPSPRIVLGRYRRYSYTRLQSGFGPPWEDPLSPASFPSASSSCLFVSQGVLAQASPVCAHQRYTTTTKPGPACPATTSFPPIHGPITVQH